MQVVLNVIFVSSGSFWAIYSAANKLYDELDPNSRFNRLLSQIIGRSDDSKRRRKVISFCCLLISVVGLVITNSGILDVNKAQEAKTSTPDVGETLEEFGFTKSKTAEELKSAVGRTPGEVSARTLEMIDQATAELDSSNWSVADSLYSAVITLFPDVGQIRFNRARARFYQGQWERAVADLQSVLECCEDKCSSYYNIALIYQMRDMAMSAIAYYDSAIAERQDYYSAYHNRGVQLYEVGKLTAAEQDLRKAIELKPEVAIAWLNLGNVLHLEGRIDEAVLAYKRAISIYPNYFSAYVELGVLYLSINRPESAIPILRKAIDIEYKYPRSHWILAKAFEMVGDSAGSARESEVAMSLSR